MTKKFPQVKRYGLEGAESMMIALDVIFQNACAQDLRDVVVCMPHRGRLNLLTDLLKFNPTGVFAKVKGVPEYPSTESHVCTGDVLSHIAQSVDLTYQGKSTHVSLLHNPSHLEAINPVAMGKARAKESDTFESGVEGSLGDSVLCVQLHGDAAFCGQGVVMETLGLSNLPHYSCGGSVHVVVNNQIGYTTPGYNSRSTTHTSDVAKMIHAPVIHVNGDHPEEVAKATALAVAYRNTFHKDVVLDLIAFRRWGHNELDEPSFTQPQMYNTIRARKSVPKLYEEKLESQQLLSSAESDALRDQWYKKLDSDLDAVTGFQPPATHLQGKWEGMTSPTDITQDTMIPTGVASDVLLQVGKISVQTPPNFDVHARLQKFHVQPRLQRLEQGKPLDWATAEAMAFGSLLLEGYGVRISGQDVGRGTFSQRHCMLVDQTTEKVTIPLNNLVPEQHQKKLEVANSSLSEFAVLGFEFGYSWETPKVLPIWEAQFGDFFNGAQIIIDTFVSSSEAKWLRQSGLVMLLPHGYDGTGPEHSTCRMERFLQLCNDAYNPLQPEVPRTPNMHVVFPTTPAQYFHLLRRQMIRSYRKPMIIVGPKTLLRLPQAVSELKEMETGTAFQPVLADPSITDPAKVKRVVLCTGKLYYELMKERESKGTAQEVALVRIEELCPFPAKELQQILSPLAHVEDVIWCQEEPQNQGAYSFVEPRLKSTLTQSIRYVGRVSSAAPATGVGSIHRKEQASLLADAVSL
jgi:probable 2-oxoglutarate dehydrogenase E1 component DHKTD1